jgi:hypothetical protein
MFIQRSVNARFTQRHNPDDDILNKNTDYLSNNSPRFHVAMLHVMNYMLFKIRFLLIAFIYIYIYICT